MSYTPTYMSTNCQDDEPIWQYASPADAAREYARLRERIPGSIQGIDPERMMMARCDASPQPGVPFAIEALDARLALSRVWDESKKRCMDANGSEQGRRWWRCWYLVNVEGVSASDERFNYTRQHVYRVCGKVTQIVEDVLFEREMLRHDLFAIEQDNDRATRKRVVVALMSFDDE
jgi:hypothetical protein